MTTTTRAVSVATVPPRTLEPRHRLDRALPVLLGLVAVALTAVGSWIPSFWGDEAATSMSAQRSWSSLVLEVSHVDAVHAAYYALMHVWVSMFGATPFALRFPSAIALGVAVAGVVVLVRLGGVSRTTAVIAAAVTMLLPRLSYQGEEARAYAMDAAVATWIVVAVVATLGGRLRPRVGWAVVTLLTVVGTYLFLYVGLLVVVTGVLVVARPDRHVHLRRWVSSAGVTVVAVLPIVVVGLLQKQQVAFLSHRVTTDPYSLLVTVFFGRTTVAVAAWALVLVALVTALSARHRSSPEAGLVLVGAVWAFLPLAVLVAANPVAHEFSARYATFTAPGAALLVGLGIDTVRRRTRWGGVLAGAVAVALVVPVWAAQRTPTAFNASDWSTIGELVRTHASAGDQVAFDVTVRPSRRELLAMRTYPRDFAGLRQVQVTMPYWQNRTWNDAAMTVDAAVAAHRFTAGRLWLLQDAHGGTVSHEGEAALVADGFHQVGRWRTPSSVLLEYER